MPVDGTSLNLSQILSADVRRNLLQQSNQHFSIDSRPGPVDTAELSELARKALENGGNLPSGQSAASPGNNGAELYNPVPSPGQPQSQEQTSNPQPAEVSLETQRQLALNAQSPSAQAAQSVLQLFR